MKNRLERFVATLVVTATFLILLVFSSIASSAFHLEEATVLEIQQAYDTGALTAVKLVQLYLNRIIAYDDRGPKINSISTINPRLLEIVAKLDREHKVSGPRSPLHGVPVLLKDNINTYDLPTTNGSVILKTQFLQMTPILPKPCGQY